jgi:hypothetical protein
MEAHENASPATPSQDKGYPAQFDGVAGWLGFLVASLIVLGPILSIVTTALELSNTEQLNPWVQYNPLWKTALFIAWGSVAAYSLVSIYAGIRLLRKHVPSSVVIAILCLWVAGPLLTWAGLIALSDAGAETNAADAGAALGRPIIWATFWTLYLIFSKRVRVTYLGGKRLKSAFRGNWRNITRRTRQFVFFGVSWVVLAFLYFQVVAPLDLYPERGEVQRMWAIILLPPLLLWLGAWAYARVVGNED